MDSVDSGSCFRSFWFFWKILGINETPGKYRRLYSVYSVTVILFICVAFPVTIFIPLLVSHLTIEDMVKAFAGGFTCFAGSAKFLSIFYRLQIVHEIQTLFKVLDKRIQHAEDRAYFQVIRRQVRHVTIAYVTVYFSIAVASMIQYLFQTERNLMWIEWFPFDWTASSLNFNLAYMYQFLGVNWEIMQNYTNDCFPAVTLCLLAGHVKLLGKRVSRIGHDDQTVNENENDLRQCIDDQKVLYELFQSVEKIISIPIFLQYAVNSSTICVSAAALVFYAPTAVDKFFWLTFLLAMPLQIFPTCYYGSILQEMFDKLPLHIFSSNWIYQSRTYRRDMIIFTERSLKPCVALAGNMFRVHLDTFFSICRGAYSLFALIMNLN